MRSPARPHRPGHGCRPAPPPVPSRRRRNLHRRSEHQLHEFLHGILHVFARSTAAGARRRVHPGAGGDLREDPGNHRPGGTGILMQGGLHPGLKIEWYEDLLRAIKRRFRIHLHCFSSPEIVNNRRGERPQPARHDHPPEGCRAGFDSRRRRGDPRRRRAAPHQRAEMLDPGMGGCAPGSAPAGHAHHRHHDVRLRARASRNA